MAEVRQTVDAVLLIILLPCPDRVVVDEQHPGCRLTGQAIVQKQHRVGPTPQAVRRRPVSSQLDQVFTRFSIEEAAPDHEND